MKIKQKKSPYELYRRKIFLNFQRVPRFPMYSPASRVGFSANISSLPAGSEAAPAILFPGPGVPETAGCAATKRRCGKITGLWSVDKQRRNSLGHNTPFARNTLVHVYISMESDAPKNRKTKKYEANEPLQSIYQELSNLYFLSSSNKKRKNYYRTDNRKLMTYKIFLNLPQSVWECNNLFVPNAMITVYLRGKHKNHKNTITIYVWNVPNKLLLEWCKIWVARQIYNIPRAKKDV